VPYQGWVVVRKARLPRDVVPLVLRGRQLPLLLKAIFQKERVIICKTAGEASPPDSATRSKYSGGKQDIQRSLP
jgi:hypothetical protein